jgi:hypothetical protein
MYPPSTCRTTPVMYPACSDEWNATAHQIVYAFGLHVTGTTDVHRDL